MGRPGLHQGHVIPFCPFHMSPSWSSPGGLSSLDSCVHPQSLWTPSSPAPTCSQSSVLSRRLFLVSCSKLVHTLFVKCYIRCQERGQNDSVSPRSVNTPLNRLTDTLQVSSLTVVSLTLALTSLCLPSHMDSPVRTEFCPFS